MSSKQQQMNMDALLAGDLSMGIAQAETVKPVEVQKVEPARVSALEHAQARDAEYLATAFESTLAKAAGNWELEFTSLEFAEKARVFEKREKQDFAAALFLARGASFS
eukprot:CAMPEP_0184309802 /NCGR_PEP_ID=MMETSP1049-20130417/19473_1 /TAXON_ID=77928 /ORGANISM="Proteomonas sulcata, Strain CCMP704" /LENGTH=107 /DNA_ID=CAMNT_0026622837 /DNA_START=365 /DNA_END=688 /DNA_ORIENTATION=+